LTKINLEKVAAILMSHVRLY